MSLKIGWFASDEDPRSYKLFTDTYRAIKDLNLDVSISYLFSDSGQKDRETDQFSASVKKLGIDFIPSSSETFRQNMNSLQAEKEPSSEWKDTYYSQVMEKIFKYPIDIAFLVGYTLPVSQEFMNTYTTVRFRPALPNGPSGDRSTIIWQLMGIRALKSGPSLGFLTEYDPERGIPFTYCDYLIKNEKFFPLWRDFDNKLKSSSMKEIMETDGENNPLFKAIQETEEKWEQPLLTLTVDYLSTGKISIRDQHVYLDNEIQLEGCCLTEKIQERFFHQKNKESNKEGPPENTKEKGIASEEEKEKEES